MIILKKDVTEPLGKVFLVFDHWQKNSDGSHSPIMPDGQYAGQEPNIYGQFKFDTLDDPGAYQKAKLNGQLATFWTRPQDPPYTYSWVELPN